MSTVEKFNLFGPDGKGLKDNPHGYVRYKNLQEKEAGIFYLDPSRDLPTVENKVYFYQGKQKPEEKEYIKVMITELEPMKESDGHGGLKVTHVYQVINWEIVNISKILRTYIIEGHDKPLQQEEYLDFMSLSIKRKYLTDQIRYSLALYTVASPEMNQYQKGGINTSILTNFEPEKVWRSYKRLNSVIPPEFKKPEALFFYEHKEFDKTPNKKKYEDSDFLNSRAREISISYQTNLAVPVELPLPLNVEFRFAKDVREDFKYDLAAGRGFMLDTLSFQPVIPDEEKRYFLDTVYEFRDQFRSLHNDFFWLKKSLDISASLLVRLCSSFARFNFETTVNKENIREAKDLWSDLQRDVIKIGAAAKIFKKFYDNTADEKRVLAELTTMKETGIETTVENLKAYSKVDLRDIDDILSHLRRKYYIYFTNRKTIEFIND